MKKNIYTADASEFFPFLLFTRHIKFISDVKSRFASNFFHFLNLDKTNLTDSCLLQPEPPRNFGDISLTKAILRKYLKENCSLELHLQLSFKYFANLCFIPKLFSKVSQVQTTFGEDISRHEWIIKITFSAVFTCRVSARRRGRGYWCQSPEPWRPRQRITKDCRHRAQSQPGALWAAVGWTWWCGWWRWFRCWGRRKSQQQGACCTWSWRCSPNPYPWRSRWSHDSGAEWAPE